MAPPVVMKPIADPGPRTEGAGGEAAVGTRHATDIRSSRILPFPVQIRALVRRLLSIAALGQLSRGHGFMGGRRVTLVATADDLRPWRRH